jgi:dihydrofolate reductase
MKSKPILALLVAATPAGEIGYRNTIPWRLKGDLPRFKQLTEGNVIVSGRSTHETLPAVMGGRIRIVMSRSPEYVSQVHDPENNIYGVANFDEALELARTFKTEAIFFIGGASVYEDAMKFVDKAFVTLVHKTAPKYDTVIKGFTFAPEDWVVVSERHITEPDSLHPQINLPSHTYYVFERIENKVTKS